MPGVRDELRSLPSWLAVLAVVALAAVTLLVRLAALLVVVVSECFERADMALASRYGITPLGCRVVLLADPSYPFARAA